ncbi:hypothetical protein P7C73_g4040, partial [Tremellales sp. Uapishka_1]
MELPQLDLAFEVQAPGDEGLHPGRVIKLTEEETRLLAKEEELSCEEVRHAWEWIGGALRERGCQNVGIMLPRRLQTDVVQQQYLLVLYILSIRPVLSSSFPTVLAYASEKSRSWRDKLIAAVKETKNPSDLAEVLKWTIRRLVIRPTTTTTKSQISFFHVVAGISPESSWYTSFVQAEHASSYPLDTYGKLLVPTLSKEVANYLDQVFEVWAGIATYSDTNTMSGGRLSYLLGWWLLGMGTREKKNENSQWKALYEEWKVAGQRVEHMFYAWIRWQSTKQTMPIRLMELVEDYPFGESSASATHLPLPPPSSFPRKTLCLILETAVIPAGITPRDILAAALGAISSTRPLWDQIRQSVAAPDQTLNSISIEKLLSEETLSFLQETSPLPETNRINPEDVPLTSTVDGPLYRPFHMTTPPLSLQRRGTLASTHSQSRRHSLSYGAPEGQPANEGTLSSPAGGSADDSADWLDFQKSGFGDAPSALKSLQLALNDDIRLPITPPPHSKRPSVSRQSTKFTAPVTPPQAVYTISSEEIIDVEDLFLSFVEDGQLDPPSSSKWPPFALLRLLHPVTLGEDTVEWLLITMEKQRPKPIRHVSEQSPDRSFLFGPTRAASPKLVESKSGPSLRDLAGNFSKRTSSYGTGVRKLFGSNRGVSRQNSEGPNTLDALSEGNADINSPVPTEYTVGEMGQMVLIPSALPRQPILTPGGSDPTRLHSFNPTIDTDPAEWKFVNEGGAHIVCGYRGLSADYIGKILRIRKPKKGSDTPPASPTSEWTELELEWRDQLLPKLVPEDLLVSAKDVVLGHDWVSKLLTATDENRTEARKEAGGVEGATKALLMEDLTWKSGEGTTVLAVEIKPKWGFLPSDKWMTPAESVPIKTQHCRFCLHQHLKNPGSAVDYCPLDLYSGDEDKMRKSMRDLWGGWTASGGKGNNWRVSVDGKEVSPSELNLIPALEGDHVASTIDLILPLLLSSQVLSILKTLQSSLDPTDISDLVARFKITHPEDELSARELVPEPTAVELVEFVDLYLRDKTGGSREGEWSLRQRLIAYSLSAIFKDCSIFIKVVLDANSKVDHEKSYVKLIDLDLKPLRSLKHWSDLDEKIWRNWADKETSERASRPRTVASTSISGFSALENSSTRALFVPTPSDTPPVQEVETNPLSLEDALLISPTRPDVRPERRDRSPAPSPSPSLSLAVLPHLEELGLGADVVSGTTHLAHVAEAEQVKVPSPSASQRELAIEPTPEILEDETIVPAHEDIRTETAIPQKASGAREALATIETSHEERDTTLEAAPSSEPLEAKPEVDGPTPSFEGGDPPVPQPMGSSETPAKREGRSAAADEAVVKAELPLRSDKGNDAEMEDNQIVAEPVGDRAHAAIIASALVSLRDTPVQESSDTVAPMRDLVDVENTTVEEAPAEVTPAPEDVTAIGPVVERGSPDMNVPKVNLAEAVNVGDIESAQSECSVTSGAADAQPYLAKAGANTRDARIELPYVDYRRFEEPLALADITPAATEISVQEGAPLHIEYARIPVHPTYRVENNIEGSTSAETSIASAEESALGDAPISKAESPIDEANTPGAHVAESISEAATLSGTERRLGDGSVVPPGRPAEKPTATGPHPGGTISLGPLSPRKTELSEAGPETKDTVRSFESPTAEEAERYVPEPPLVSHHEAILEAEQAGPRTPISSSSPADIGDAERQSIQEPTATVLSEEDMEAVELASLDLRGTTDTEAFPTIHLGKGRSASEARNQVVEGNTVPSPSELSETHKSALPAGVFELPESTNRDEPEAATAERDHHAVETSETYRPVSPPRSNMETEANDEPASFDVAPTLAEPLPSSSGEEDKAPYAIASADVNLPLSEGGSRALDEEAKAASPFESVPQESIDSPGGIILTEEPAALESTAHPVPASSGPSPIESPGKTFAPVDEQPLGLAVVTAVEEDDRSRSGESDGAPRVKSEAADTPSEMAALTSVDEEGERTRGPLAVTEVGGENQDLVESALEEEPDEGERESTKVGLPETTSSALIEAHAEESGEKREVKDEERERKDVESHEDEGSPIE